MEKKPRGPPQSNPTFRSSSPSSSSSSSMAILLVLFCIFAAVPNFPIIAADSDSSASSSAVVSFTPQDNFLIDCGSNAQTTNSDGRVFSSDQSAGKYFSSNGRDVLVSVPSANVPSPIYLSARIFVDQATYTFHITRAGWHWIRLHFFPVKNSDFDLQTAKFTVTTDNVVLLYDFNVGNATTAFFKEYLINVTSERFSLIFKPGKGSQAFVNAIELVSAPDLLITDTGSTLFPVAQFNGLTGQSYETMYRLNVGGPEITSQNDTLGRTWLPDVQYQAPKQMVQNVSVQPSIIQYPQGGSRLIAPQTVYASAVEMANANVQTPNFNLTWNLDIDLSYQYLVRLHFCDIISKTLDDLYFNVFINDKMAVSGMDLSTLTGGLATAYFKDFVVNSSMVSTPLSIKIGPWTQGSGAINALLNGIEVLKMNNTVDSLDGEYGVDGKSVDGVNKGTVAAVGFAMMFGAFVGLGAMAFKWQKRPHDWQKRNSFSSWLLPLHAGDASFLNSKNSLGSRKSQFFSSTTGLGRYFSFAELTDATKNWDPNAVIGVGGFGNVLCARPALNPALPREQVNLAEWAMQWKRKGLLEKIMDSHLIGAINPESMKKFAEAAEKCLAEYGVDRPTMGDVLWNLEYALQLQEASSQGKAEDENKPSSAAPTSPAVVLPTAASIADNRPISSPEQGSKPAEVQVIDEHSGTAMFAHFATLNGR
ncbi:hypothetical protein U1Q18_003830 [Sarracenia purpurea var. burkii]